MDTCEEEPFFDKCDEIVEGMLFAEVGVCRIGMFSMKKLVSYEKISPLVSPK